MEFFISQLKKVVKSTVITTMLIAILWGVLYHLTDFGTVKNYFWVGVAVCLLNSVIITLRQRQKCVTLQVYGSWVVMAGLVLVLYHAGFEAAAVLVAAAITVSPLFWASVYEAIVGLTLLIKLMLLI